MTSESFGCHDVSRHRLGASAKWESCCFSLLEGVPRSLWWLPASSGCTARGSGATGRGWEALWVGGAFVQYAQPLASGSRPSWSRPARANSSQFWAGPESNHDHRDPAQTAGRERWRRTCAGGTGLYRTNHGLSLLRGLVSTVLTLTSLASKRPAGIVEILRFFFGAQCRSGVDVSTMDTHTPSCLAPQPPSPPGPPACPGFPPERVSQKS